MNGSPVWPSGPKLAISATLAPRATERHLLLVFLNMEHSGWTKEQVEAYREVPPLPEGASDAQRAQLAAYDAFDARFESRKAVNRAAKRALRLDPDCIDAFLAQWQIEWEDSPKALELATKAHAAAREALSTAEAPPTHEDDLWSNFVNRPIVRAYTALALTLWAHERFEEAVAMAREVLAMNPGDNLGIRWHLQNWYLTLGRVRPARQLLRDYTDEPWAAAAFAGALAEFAHSGPSKKARKCLARAQEISPFMFRILRSPVESIDVPVTWDYYISGSWQEALQWHPVVRPAWDAFPRALEWYLEMDEQPDFVRRTEEGLVRLVLDMAEESGLSFPDAVRALQEKGLLPDYDL